MEEIEASGSTMPEWLKKVYSVMIRFVTPALILIVEISGVRGEIIAKDYAVIIVAYGMIIICAIIYFLFFKNSYTGMNADEHKN